MVLDPLSWPHTQLRRCEAGTKRTGGGEGCRRGEEEGEDVGEGAPATAEDASAVSVEFIACLGYLCASLASRHCVCRCLWTSVVFVLSTLPVFLSSCYPCMFQARMCVILRVAVPSVASTRCRCSKPRRSTRARRHSRLYWRTRNGRVLALPESVDAWASLWSAVMLSGCLRLCCSRSEKRCRSYLLCLASALGCMVYALLLARRHQHCGSLASFASAAAVKTTQLVSFRVLLALELDTRSASTE